MTILYPLGCLEAASPALHLFFECSSQPSIPTPDVEKKSFARSYYCCYKPGDGGFFVLFCFIFKISSQNQRFSNDCINSKQTKKPKKREVFSINPVCGVLAFKRRGPGRGGGASDGIGRAGGLFSTFQVYRGRCSVALTLASL